MKLNIGCGRNILEGWINVDSVTLPGVDIVMDLDNDPRFSRLPVPPTPGVAEDSVEEFLCSHVLEHLHYPLPLMQELWRVAKNGATMTVRVPYGSSDDADEDPTHVRRFFLQSFGYFSQPYYWRADYGYRGDWACDSIVLYPNPNSLAYVNRMAPEFFLQNVMSQRNVVSEMVATLRAVKPARQPLRELQRAPQLGIWNAS